MKLNTHLAKAADSSNTYSQNTVAAVAKFHLAMALEQSHVKCWLKVCSQPDFPPLKEVKHWEEILTCRVKSSQEQSDTGQLYHMK